MTAWFIPLFAVGFIAASIVAFRHYVARIDRARDWLSGGALLLDVDSAGEFALRHPGVAISLPLDKIAAHVADLGSRDQRVVVFAHSWRRGALAVHGLRQLGFRAVLNAAGIMTRERLSAAAQSAVDARRTPLLQQLGLIGQNNDVVEKLSRPPSRDPAADASDPSSSDSSVVTRNVTFGRILVPVDYSAGSRRALRTALALQELMGSEVHLLHLAEEGADDHFIESTGGSTTTPEDLVEDAKRRLVRFVNNVSPGRPSEVSVHALAAVEVVDGIERVAKEVGATLVLLSRGATDSTFRTRAERVARNVKGAVLLL